MDTPENIENTKEGSKKLGELLVSYRNKVGMDIDQAADAMCLTRGTLEALENEDFHLLPEAPYIRGYLRGYAKLADVSSAEAIALYESINGGDGLINPTYHFTPSAKTDNLSPSGLSSTVLRLGGLLLLLIVLAVVSTIPGVKDWAGEIWAEFSSETPKEQLASDENVVATEDNSGDKNRTQLALPKNTETLTLASSDSDKQTSDDEQKQKDESSSDTSSSENLGGDIKREDESEEGKASSGEEAGDASSTTDDESSEGSEADGKSDQADSENGADESGTDSGAATSGDGESSDEAENTDGASEGASSESDENKTDENADENEAQQTEGETEQADADTESTDVDLADVNVEAGEVAIKLVFEDEVWMRIKKKGGKQVFEGLRQKGEVHELKTVKPLDFKVGNAPGVKIYVNGELYDQSAHQRGVVSRFDLE